MQRATRIWLIVLIVLIGYSDGFSSIQPLNQDVFITSAAALEAVLSILLLINDLDFPGFIFYIVAMAILGLGIYLRNKRKS